MSLYFVHKNNENRIHLLCTNYSLFFPITALFKIRNKLIPSIDESQDLYSLGVALKVVWKQYQHLSRGLAVVMIVT